MVHVKDTSRRWVHTGTGRNARPGLRSPAGELSQGGVRAVAHGAVAGLGGVRAFGEGQRAPVHRLSPALVAARYRV